MQALGALLFVEVDESFGIAVRGEPMAPADQLVAKFLIVINLTVEYHPYRAVFIGNRLMARAQVDDAEAPHADSARAVGVNTFIIRSAMADQVGHHSNVINARLTVLKEEASDPAHIG